MGLAEPTEQNDSEKVHDNKDVRVLAVRNKKIIISIVNTIPAGEKLLTTSTEMNLLEGGYNIRVRKVWIEMTD